jgi:hypothetical protein
VAIAGIEMATPFPNKARGATQSLPWEKEKDYHNLEEVAWD